jgi:hypothetical protein
MPLLSATCSGCCSVNSNGQYEALCIMKQMYDLPLTASQSVGIVSIYSYNESVNPYTFFWSCMTRKGS